MYNYAQVCVGVRERGKFFIKVIFVKRYIYISVTSI